MSVLRPTVQIKSANKFSMLDNDDVSAQTDVKPKASHGNVASSNASQTRVRFADSPVEHPSSPSTSASPRSGGRPKSILVNKSTTKAEEQSFAETAGSDVASNTASTTKVSASKDAAAESSNLDDLSTTGLGNAAVILKAQGYSQEEIETAHVLMIAGGWTYDDSLGLDYDTALALAMLDFLKHQQAAIEQEAKRNIERRREQQDKEKAKANTKATLRKPQATPSASKAKAASSATASETKDIKVQSPEVPAKSEEPQAAPELEVDPSLLAPSASETLAPSPVNAVSAGSTAAATAHPSGDVSAADEDDDDEDDDYQSGTHASAAAVKVPEADTKPAELISSGTAEGVSPSEPSNVTPPSPVVAAASTSPDIPFQDVTHEAVAAVPAETEAEVSPLSLELEQSGPALEAIAATWSPEVNDEHRLLLGKWSMNLSALEMEATISRAKLARAPQALLNALASESASNSLSQQQQAELGELRKARDSIVRFMSILAALGSSRTLDLLVIRLIGGVVSRISRLQQQINECQTKPETAAANPFINLAAYREQLNQLTATLQTVLPPLIELHDRALGTANQVSGTTYYNDLINSLIADGESLLDVDVNAKSQDVGGLFATSLANLLATSRGTLSSIRRLEVQLSIISAGVPANIFPESLFSIPTPRLSKTAKGRDTKDPMSIEDIAVDLISPRLLEAAKQSSVLADAVKRAQATRAELACSKELATLVSASHLIQKEAHDMQYALHHTERDLLSDAALVSQRAAALSALEQNYKAQRESALETFMRTVSSQLATGAAVRERREQLLQRKKQLERELAAINEELSGLDVPLHVVDEKIKLGVTAYLKVVRGIAVRCTVSPPQDEPTDEEVTTVTKAVLEKGASSVAEVVDDMMLAAVRAQAKTIEVRQRCHAKLENALLMAFKYLKSRVTFDSVSVQALASNALVPVSPSANRGASQNYKKAFAQAFEAHLRAAGDIALLLMQRVRTCEAMLQQQQALQAQQSASGVLPAVLEEQHNTTIRQLAECISNDQAELARLSTSVQDWVTKTSRATALDHELVTLLTEALGRVLHQDGQTAQGFPFNLQADYEVLTRFVQTVREKNSQKSAEQPGLSSPARAANPVHGSESTKTPRAQKSSADATSTTSTAPAEQPKTPAAPKNPSAKASPTVAATPEPNASTEAPQPAKPITSQDRPQRRDRAFPHGRGGRGGFTSRGGSRGGARAGGNA